MITQVLSTNYESEIITLLKKIYQNKVTLSEVDTIELKNYETEDYALLGIIGLLINNKPRILLGRKQPFDIGFTVNSIDDNFFNCVVVYPNGSHYFTLQRE